ncbi:MAG: GNAT family N-acetyltransferase [Actinobacteria bacterium RBG_16_68_21]|nr:MAG: GNAT family N-acetyltransferase [Actinobacteria bacterium RBG_16_68_21]
MPFKVEWRGDFANSELEELHAEGFGHPPLDTADWEATVTAHSLGWVCARDETGLIGFVNVAWDGALHAFILDTVVAERARRQGVGTRLVEVATDRARDAGCEWLHVDFEEELGAFYFDACRFSPTPAGLIRL